MEVIPAEAELFCRHLALDRRGGGGAAQRGFGGVEGQQLLLLAPTRLSCI